MEPKGEMMGPRNQGHSVVAAALAIAALAPLSAYALDLSKVPPAETVEEAKRTFHERRDAVIDYFADQPLSALQFNIGQKNYFAKPLIAKLIRGREVAEVNALLMDRENVRPFGNPGTHFAGFLGGVCRRKGDYDFMMQGLMHLLYLFKDQPALLWPETRERIMNELITVHGAKHATSIRVCGLKFPETENHILMTEGVRYLQNQLLLEELKKQGRYDEDLDNSRNGFNEWWLESLKMFLREDFWEYNAKPYQGFTIQAIQLVYEYAQDPKVRLTAQTVLDYVAARTAIQSNGLRRAVPWRRQVRYKDISVLIGSANGDREIDRLLLYAGNTQVLSELERPFWVPWHAGFALYPAVGSYRIPDLILDLAISKEHNPYLQTFKHDGFEAFSSSKSYLITGSGIHVKGSGVKSHFDQDELEGWTVPTTLMPSRSGLDWSEFIRIDGIKDYKKRRSVCLTRDFACGYNPVIPEHIPEQCRETQGRWNFFNFASPRCPLDYGFYAMVYVGESKDKERVKKGDDTFGFFEATEASLMSYERFKGEILRRNGHFGFRDTQDGLYITSKGNLIRFSVSPKVENQIVALEGVPEPSKLSEFPLARGDVMDADGSGRVVVKNRYLNRRLVLDLSDPSKPMRRIEPLE